MKACNDILRIPYGNPFRIHLCCKNIVPSEDNEVTFADITDLVAVLKRFPDFHTDVDYELTDEGDMLITLPAGMLEKSLYSLELTGQYDGQPWRWKALPIFRIVDANACGNVQGMETFGEETYYLDDTLEVEMDGDTLILTTHGLATLDDGVVTLQSGNTVDIDKIKKSVTIQHYPNGNTQNHFEGQAWEGHCL